MNYKKYKEKREEFEKEWEVIRHQYEALGMNQESINKMHDYDLKVFWSDNRFLNYNYRLDLHNIGDYEPKKPFMVLVIDKTSCPDVTYDTGRKFYWLDDIEDRGLYKRLKMLREEDLEFLTFLVNRYSPKDLMEEYGVSQQAINRKKHRILKFLKKY